MYTLMRNIQNERTKKKRKKYFNNFQNVVSEHKFTLKLKPNKTIACRREIKTRMKHFVIMQIFQRNEGR